MKYLACTNVVAAMLVVLQAAASACDQDQVMHPYFLSIPVTPNNYAQIAKYAVLQADAAQSCITQSAGHAKTHYLLMRAVALSTAAQAMDNLPEADRTKEALYSREAVDIAKPIANDPNALDREKKGARDILHVSTWLKKIG